MNATANLEQTRKRKEIQGPGQDQEVDLKVEYYLIEKTVGEGGTIIGKTISYKSGRGEFCANIWNQAWNSAKI